MPGGRLPENVNQRICQFLTIKVVAVAQGNLRSGRLRENFWNSIWVWNKTGYLQSGLLQEVVAYEKWSLWERELTVP